MSRVRSIQRCIRKDAYKSVTADSNVPWRSLDIFIVPNWFLYTDAVNEDIRIVLSPYGIPSINLFLMPACVRNLHHHSQWLELLVEVALDIP